MDVNQATQAIQTRLDDSGWFDDVTHDELREISNILQELSPADARQVYDNLKADGKLDKWVSEMNSGGWFGTGGLSASEKTDLFNSLANRLSGEQLADFSGHLDHDGVVALGQSVASHGRSDIAVDYVKALSSRTTEGGHTRSDNSLFVNRAITEDPEARAIGEVLATLRGHDFNQAVTSLTPAQLTAVMKTASGSNLTTTSGMRGSSTAVDYDPRLLTQIIDNAAKSIDPAVKATVFQAASAQLKEISDAGNVMVPYLGKDADARAITDAMTRLLRSDTTAIMHELEDNLDRDGASLIPYTTAMVDQNRSAELGEIITDLQLGNDRRTGAVERFEQTIPGTTGQPYYANAQALGYFVGAVQVGLAENSASAKDTGDLLKNIFGIVTGAGGAANPGAGVAGAVLNGLSAVTVDRVVKSVENGNKDIRTALRELAFPHDSQGGLYRGPAEGAYDEAVGRVIDANGNN